MLVLFTWGSGQFVYYEYVDNAIAFGDVPAWICEIIMPIGGGDGATLLSVNGKALT